MVNKTPTNRWRQPDQSRRTASAATSSVEVLVLCATVAAAAAAVTLGGLKLPPSQAD